MWQSRRQLLRALARKGEDVSFDAACSISIADTILDFASVVVRQLAEPAGLDALRHTIELAVSIWNAHTLARPEWGQPQHLAELTRLVSISASQQMLMVFEQLTAVKLSRFAEDMRVVCEWQVTADAAGRARFDCMARLPPGKPS
jgi:hypothetical protein